MSKDKDENKNKDKINSENKNGRKETRARMSNKNYIWNSMKIDNRKIKNWKNWKKSWKLKIEKAH